MMETICIWLCIAIIALGIVLDVWLKMNTPKGA